MTAEDWLYVPAVETHLFPSRHVEQIFKVQVMQPAQTRGEQRRFPVVYATDGNFAFDALKGISYSIQAFARDAPPFILVGIGYPSDSPFGGFMLRARDMTFPQYPRLNLVPPRIEDVPVAREGAKSFYGSADFQHFIAEELIPFIDERYATSPGDRAYFGHSLGGGFGLHTLFSEPGLFRNYIVSSPGLIYHGDAAPGFHYEDYDFVLEEARGFIASGRSLDGIRLYMSVGGEEEFELDMPQWQLTSSFYRMARLMKAAAIPGLELTTEVLSGETHMTAWPTAFSRGIRTILSKR
jgi:predicted alpha/beta superfamily hydrolase